MSPKEDAAERKQQILAAAAALFAESGYYKTTTAHVAKAVGVTQPYIFHFFRTKEELYLAVLKQAAERILHAFTIADAPPEQLPEAMGRAFGELLGDYRSEILLVMTSFTIPEPAIREYTRTEFELVFDRVKERFEKAGLPNAGMMASTFIGQGLALTMSELLQSPKLFDWKKPHEH
ncbi:TetR/AcrR family transcriptional regulator [Paenibacillus sp.]|uniref:TetR/AcrR family transcriptional regulator n=1 Tax=Paenibacillus sp. TaxID=58172 RepID=UPI002D301312|nr:TetR/AcrR family transcriptional regulator [Paenibacillus sp.]HZG58375.1 TetR/AcrR family transcriptional regulator [Paenibacillus sp.]